MQNTNTFEKIVYWLLTCTLIVDALNGLIQTVFSVQSSIIGIVFRVALIVFFLYFYCRLNRNGISIIGILLVFFGINICGGYFFYSKQINSLLYDIMEATRLSLSLIISFSLINLLKKKYISRDTLINVIFSSIRIVLIIYGISLLFGLGNSTYGDAGYKAIFISNNALNITLIILFVFQTEKAFKEKNIINIIYALLLFIILIMLGSKSSFIFIIFYFFMKMIYTKDPKDYLKYSLYFIAVLSISCFIISLLFGDLFRDIVMRQLYFLQKEANSLHTYLLSGRDILLNAAFDNYTNNFSLYSLLFGIGSYFHQLGIALILKIYSFKNIEMDLFDILFSYGIFGLILTYGSHLYIYVKNKNELKRQGKYAELICFLCLMIFSIAGGHVYMDAMSSTYLAIIVSLLYI